MRTIHYFIQCQKSKYFHYKKKRKERNDAETIEFMGINTVGYFACARFSNLIYKFSNKKKEENRCEGNKTVIKIGHTQNNIKKQKLLKQNEEYRLHIHRYYLLYILYIVYVISCSFHAFRSLYGIDKKKNGMKHCRHGSIDRNKVYLEWQ